MSVGTGSRSSMTILTNCVGQVGIRPAWRALVAGGSALDAVEQGARAVEADPTVPTVGRGGSPDLLGRMACDAAIMDGATRAAGAVGAVRDHLHTISVARQVMERLPHVVLVGEGAERFAREVGAETAAMLTDAARADHTRWLEQHLPPQVRETLAHTPLAEHVWTLGEAHAAAETAHGTTVFLARAPNGDIAVGASTAGWPQRYPGRLGDSPVIGAGIYADNRYGACGCTHTGEMTIRAGTARSVVHSMKRGATVEEACREAAADLRDLRGGFIGPVMIFAIDRDGRPCAMCTHDVGAARVFYTQGDSDEEPREGRAAIVDG